MCPTSDLGRLKYKIVGLFYNQLGTVSIPYNVTSEQETRDIGYLFLSKVIIKIFIGFFYKNKRVCNGFLNLRRFLIKTSKKRQREKVL